MPKKKEIKICFRSYDEGMVILETIHNKGFVRDSYNLVKERSFEGKDNGCFYIVEKGKANKITSFTIVDLDKDDYQELIDLLDQNQFEWEEVK